MVQGVQVSAPFGRYGSAVEILEVVLNSESTGMKQESSLSATKTEGFGVGNI